MNNLILRPRLRGCIVVTVAAMSIGLAGCGAGDSTGNASGDYELLYVSGISGLLSPSAKAFERGMNAHVDFLNEEGGINGRQLNLTVEDNQSDPTRGVTVVQQALTSDRHPEVVFPGVSSNEALAVAPLLTREKIPHIVSASTPKLDDVNQYPYTFSYAGKQADYVAGVREFVAQEGGGDRIALAVPNDALGEAAAMSFEEVFADSETEVSYFDPEAVDFTPTYQKLIASRPDWIMMEGAGGQVPIMLASRVKAGGESIPTILGITASSAPLLDFASEEQRVNVYSTLLPLQRYIDPKDRSDEFVEFNERVTAQGPLEVSLAIYASGWDMIGLWARAAEQAGEDASGDEVVAALEDLTISEDDTQFPMFGAEYSAESHYPEGVPTRIEFGQVQATKDGMLIVE
jgi:branched-chain amino acid transport system substrate-binding protein